MSAFRSFPSEDDLGVIRSIGLPNSVQRYGFQDFLTLLVIFGLGFVFNWILSSWRKDSKKKLDDLMSQFEGQKSELQRSERNSLYFYQMKYRARIGQNAFYIAFGCLVFAGYKSPSITQLILYDNAHLSIPLFFALVIVFL